MMRREYKYKKEENELNEIQNIYLKLEMDNISWIIIYSYNSEKVVI